MAGPPIPMFESAVAITVSQQPSRAALPANTRPTAIPTLGTSPESRAKCSNARVSRPAITGMSVSPGRPPPPSAKSTTGSRKRSISSKMRSFLAWLRWPCVPASTV